MRRVTVPAKQRKEAQATELSYEMYTTPRHLSQSRFPFKSLQGIRCPNFSIDTHEPKLARVSHTSSIEPSHANFGDSSMPTIEPTIDPRIRFKLLSSTVRTRTMMEGGRRATDRARRAACSNNSMVLLWRPFLVTLQVHYPVLSNNYLLSSSVNERSALGPHQSLRPDWYRVDISPVKQNDRT